MVSAFRPKPFTHWKTRSCRNFGGRRPAADDPIVRARQVTENSSVRIEPLLTLDARYDRYIFPTLRARLRQPASTAVLLGLRVGDRPAGLAYCYHSEEHGSTWLTSLHVDPGCRRQGGGSLLLTAAEQACRYKGWTELRVRVAAESPGTAALLALLRRHGWPAPALLLVNLLCEAGPIHASVSTWPAVAHWFANPGRYTFDPWSEPNDADQVALTRLRGQQSCQPMMDPARYSAAIDPACSLAVRRAGELVGWVLAVPLSGTMVAAYGERVSRHYVSAYLDEPLWSTAALVVGYCIAFGRQVAAYGTHSLAMYYSSLPRMQALTRRRFAPFALKFSEILETCKPLAQGSAATGGGGLTA
jgi:GNAT superfamily N-acetyltransferase